MKKVRLDLFKLHDEDDKGQGRIKAVLNLKLQSLLKELVEEIRESKNLKLKEIAKNIGLSYYNFYCSLNRNKVPLVVIQRLIVLWSKVTNKLQKEIKDKKIEIQDSIKQLTYGAGNTHKIVDAPKFLTVNLCKIAGSIVADGNLHSSSKRTQYIIDLKDRYKDNLDNFSMWTENEFGIKTRPRENKRKNLWRISFGNKIVYRYLNKIFEIPRGKKSEKVKMPDIIKNSSLRYQIAFTTGVLMFDGGIGFRRAYFNLSTKSRLLIKDIEGVMKKIGIEPDYISDSLVPSTNVFELRLWKKNKLKKLLEVFIEPNTIKWFQLNLHINGFSKVTNLEDMIKKLNFLYPKVRDAATFKDIIKVTEKLEFATIRQIQEIFNKNDRVICDYLNTLEKWNILKSTRNGIYKVWMINPELKIKGG